MTGAPQFWPKLRPCACGADAVVIGIGSEPVRAIIGGIDTVIQRGRPDVLLCVACAQTAGWPRQYASEATAS